MPTESPDPVEGCYNAHMRIAPGKVVDGRVELDAELPEGASVTVLVLEGDETFEADTDTEQMLSEAIAQCDRDQTTPLKDFLAELRGRG
jgi:beta-lactam-binding protein with PASTA domain